MAKKKIDEATKQKVREAHAGGLSMRKIAKEFGIGLSSVSRIVNAEVEQKGDKRVTKKGIKTERQKRIEEIERKILELEKKVFELEAGKRS